MLGMKLLIEIENYVQHEEINKLLMFQLAAAHKLELFAMSAKKKTEPSYAFSMQLTEFNIARLCKKKQTAEIVGILQLRQHQFVWKFFDFYFSLFTRFH